MENSRTSLSPCNYILYRIKTLFCKQKPIHNFFVIYIQVGGTLGANKYLYVYANILKHTFLMI